MSLKPAKNGVVPEVGWNLKLGYMPTLGKLKIEPTCPHGSGDGKVWWSVPLTEIIRQTGVTKEQLRAHIAEAERPALPGSDLSTEDLCDSFITPERVKGKTVLDVGGYDGRAAAKALDAGATQAVVVDNLQWERYGWPKPHLRSDVECVVSDFMTLHFASADVVFLFNVIYHVTDPYGALAHLRTITKERLLICSLVVWDDRPVWYPRAPREVNEQDDTVYWSPSDAGLKKLLEVTGWKNITELGKTTERLVLEATPT